MTSQVRATRSEQKDKLLPLVKNIVPVASGKGGVGKSTVSANLAVALAKLGARVGLMDADVYGPTIPTLMGAGPAPAQRTPAVACGVKIMSMGFFVPKGEATIWRGPMLTAGGFSTGCNGRKKGDERGADESDTGRLRRR
jgi:ATP-binding protein involved in chromosome partitioning